MPDELYHTIVKLLPIVSVDIIPARQNKGHWELGIITRATGQETNKPALIGGRIMYNEAIGAAISRHLQKDCQLTNFAMLEGNSVERPFHVQQYRHAVTAESGNGFDPSKHSIGLTYLVTLSEDPQPRDEASDFYWIDAGQVPVPSAYNQHQLMRLAFEFIERNS